MPQQLLRDFLVIFFAGLALLVVREAFARWDAEQHRAQRRATEVVYEKCLQTCATQCRKDSK